MNTYHSLNNKMNITSVGPINAQLTIAKVKKHCGKSFIKISAVA